MPHEVWTHQHLLAGAGLDTLAAAAELLPGDGVLRARATRRRQAEDTWRLAPTGSGVAAPHGSIARSAPCGAARCRSVRMPLRQSQVSAAPERAGSRCPAGHLRCPRVRTAATSRLRRPGQRDQHRRASATCAALPWRRNGGCGFAAAGRPAGHRGRCPRSCGTGHGGRCGCPLLLPEPRSVSGRLAGVRTAGVHHGHRRRLRECLLLQEAIAG
jgi:hypothetical protein